MESTTRSFFEARFAQDFGDVRIHAGDQAAATASAAAALAYTVGDDIVFGSGQYAPHSTRGRHLLAHELTHVVQQQRSQTLQRQASGPVPSGAAACPGYEPNEIRQSRTSAGHLSGDIWDLGGGRLLIADFGVSRQSVKGSTSLDPALLAWLTEFDADPSYQLRIHGYDDCVGAPAKHIQLRTGRAHEVLALLGSSASTRVAAVGPALPGTYVNDNTSIGSRAQNRGVVVEFERHVTLAPTQVTVPRPPRPPTADCGSSQRAEIANALPLAKAMVDNALSVMGQPPTAPIRAMLRKYFNDDSTSTYIHVIAGLQRLRSGLRTQVTYECVNPGTLMYDHFCGGITAYVWNWVGINIHLCGGAFGRSNSALAETLIHENSHMWDNTDDEEYCSLTSGCSSALSRWNAYDNADSFSTFAQDVYHNL